MTYREYSGALSDPLYGSGEGELKAALREVGHILRRRKWTILLVALLVTSSFGAYAVLTPPSYEAYTILLLEEPSQESMAEDPLRSGRIPALDRHRRNMTDQRLLLQQSLPTAMRTVRRVQRSRADIGGPVTLLQRGSEADTSHTSTAKRLLENYISVELEDSEKGNAVRISARSINPQEAALLANAYTQSYIHLTEERSRRQITAAESFLETQVMRQKERLESLEDELAQYESRSMTAGIEEETRQIVQQIGELETSLDEARVGKRRAEAALQSVEGELEEIRPKLAARVSSGVDEEITRTQSRIADLEARLEQIYIKNPAFRGTPTPSEDVVELRSQISGLREHVDRLTNKYIDEMLAVGGTDPFQVGGGDSRTYVAQLKRRAAEERVVISGADARIAALQERLLEYRDRLENIPERSTQLASIQRERMAAEETYDSLTRKLNDVQLAREATISMADIVRPALVPESPTMSRNIILLIGLFLGLVSGAVAAVLRHNTDTRIYTPEDLEARNFRSVGVVPDLEIAGGDGGWRLPAADVNGSANSGDGDVKKSMLATVPQAAAGAREAYRRLHLNLQLSREGHSVRSVLVTSPEPGAGKSTTVLNLAVTAARAGKRTLIVDADFRQPRIQRLTGAEDGPSLSDLLENGEHNLIDVVQPTSIQNLFVISQSEPLADPDVVLSSPKMERLFARLESVFDLVIFDTPPVLAVADAVFLASLCDATVIVVKAGATESEELEQTDEELRHARAEVVGTVLNRFDPSQSSQYAYRYQYQTVRASRAKR